MAANNQQATPGTALPPPPPRVVTVQEILRHDQNSICRECQGKRWLDCDLGLRSAHSLTGHVPPCSNCRFYGGRNCQCQVDRHSLNDTLFYQSNSGQRPLNPPIVRQGQNLMPNVPVTWRGRLNVGQPPIFPLNFLQRPGNFLRRPVVASRRADTASRSSHARLSPQMAPPPYQFGGPGPSSAMPFTPTLTRPTQPASIAHRAPGIYVHYYWDHDNLLHRVTTTISVIGGVIPEPDLSSQYDVQEQQHDLPYGQRGDDQQGQQDYRQQRPRRNGPSDTLGDQPERPQLISPSSLPGQAQVSRMGEVPLYHPQVPRSTTSDRITQSEAMPVEPDVNSQSHNHIRSSKKHPRDDTDDEPENNMEESAKRHRKDAGV